MKYDGIVFDMDGTLWDSAENVALSWNLASGEERFTKSDIMGVMGQTMDKIAERFFPEKNEEERTAILTRCCEAENEYLREHGGKILRQHRENPPRAREGDAAVYREQLPVGVYRSVSGFLPTGRADNGQALLGRHGASEVGEYPLDNQEKRLV